MSLKNTELSYGAIAKFFHWGLFLVFIGLYATAINMVDLPDSPDKYELYGLHKALGTLALFIAGLRLFWRTLNKTPETLNNDEAPAVKMAANAMHAFLYILMFAVPIGGIMMSQSGGYAVSFFGLFNLPTFIEKNETIFNLVHDAHGWFGYALLALIAGHIAAALWHHAIKKDNVLKAMAPFTKPMLNQTASK